MVIRTQSADKDHVVPYGVVIPITFQNPGAADKSNIDGFHSLKAKNRSSSRVWRK